MGNKELKETELCLGLPGTPKATGKRGFSETLDLKLNHESQEDLMNQRSNNNIMAKKTNLLNHPAPAAKPTPKAQVVGWPPVRSYRKNAMAQKVNGDGDGGEKTSGSGGGALVKVCMDGAPYLRKVDLKLHRSYQQLSLALAKMFSSFTMGEGKYGDEAGMIDFMNERKLMDVLNSSDYVPTYQDKDGDWMLVGDVPWEMFVESCKRLRIIRGSEAIGLAPRAMQKCKSRS